jgi:hypothetical protein
MISLLREFLAAVGSADILTSSFIRIARAEESMVTLLPSFRTGGRPHVNLSKAEVHVSIDAMSASETSRRLGNSRCVGTVRVRAIVGRQLKGGGSDT